MLAALFSLPFAIQFLRLVEVDKPLRLTCFICVYSVKSLLVLQGKATSETCCEGDVLCLTHCWTNVHLRH